MFAITYIYLLLAATMCGMGDSECVDVPQEVCDLAPNRAVVAVLSDGRQLTCKKGPGSPSLGPTREVVTFSGNGSLWTCDEVVSSEPTYLKDVKVPKAPLNAKETGAFTCYLPLSKMLTTCNPMVAGDETKIGADRRSYILTNIGRNHKLFCEEVPVDQ